MRLLVLAPSYPFPAQDGVQLRLRNLLQRLPRNTEITLTCFADVPELVIERLPAPLTGTAVRVPLPPRPQGLQASSWLQTLRMDPTLLWRFKSPVMSGQVAELARKADGVLAVGLQLSQYLSHVPRHIPVAVDNYNVESKILARLAETRSGIKRGYWKWEAAKLRVAERKLLHQAGNVFAISEADRQGMAELAPRAQLHLLPMAIDLDYFGAVVEPLQAGPTRFTFVGAFNWHVNEDAAQWMCEKVWPRVRQQLPDAELHLVGREPSALVRALTRDPSICVSGTVPDVRPYVAASTALLVPLRYGSGVRTKILEAFAARRPVVSTRIGCEGLPVRADEHLAVADSEEEFAAACVRMAREPAYAQRLVSNAYQLVAEQDREATAQLSRLFTRVFANRETTAAAQATR